SFLARDVCHKTDPRAKIPMRRTPRAISGTRAERPEGIPGTRTGAERVPDRTGSLGLTVSPDRDLSTVVAMAHSSMPTWDADVAVDPPGEDTLRLILVAK